MKKSTVKFLLAWCTSLLLAALLAWLFGATLAGTWPDGLLVYPPEGNAPPVPSDAFHIGMAIGWFFACLCLTVIALSIFSLNRLKQTPLSYLPAPLSLAALCCIGLLFIALKLAG
jgi:hypothetical protein